MKLHKILPIIFLIIAMMISCSQETVINENISGEATTPDTKICVNIKTENSRTVRPEITKWEITVTNKSDANLEFSRTIDGKATSATFVNVTADTYSIKVIGCNEKGKTILHALTGSFEVKPNTVNVCEIIPEDNFDYYDDNGNPRIGNLSIQISGLTDLFSKGETLLLTCTKLPETNNESDTTCDLIFNEEGKTSSVISEIPVGSYKIEITHNDEAKTKTKVNLVKDPVVNIYDNTTTEINWEWNYDSDEINTDQELKGIKIPVWNKPVSNYNFPENSIPARNGYLTANALFAEPIWDDKSYNFELTVEHTDEEGITTITIYTSEIPASEFDFINCAYDNAGALWVLSGTSETKEFSDKDSSVSELRYCYVLKNVSTGENYKFSYGDNLAPDFSVFVDGTNEYYLIGCNGSQLKLLKLSDTKIEDFEIASPIDLTNITALYISRNSNTDEIPIYIAITSSDDNGTTANIYTGTISTNDTTGTPTLELNINEEGDAESLLSLDIYSFISDENIVNQLEGNNSYFDSNAFMISDMYINEDKSKLYVTAGCVNYNNKSWYYNDYSDGGKYHSFGGLFEYELSIEDNKITCSNSDEPAKYGIDCAIPENDTNENDGYISLNAFLKKESTKDVFFLEDHIIQATSDDSKYFAGPRYIIPSGNDLLIVDSGFYGVYTTPNDNPPLTDCEKRNRIFTFNITENGLSFNSITKVDDSISFDYDYLTSSSRY